MRNRVTGKMLALVLCLSMLVCTFTGCSNSEEKTVTSIKIGVTLYDKYDTFLSELMNAMSIEASSKQDETGIRITIESYNAAKDQNTQNSQVEAMIKNGCDIICVNLVDRTEPATIINLAKEAGVPVVFFNRELVAEDLERWDRLYYVGADAGESGRLEGEIAAELFNADPACDKNGDGVCQYVLIEGEAGHQDAIVRTETSVKALVDAGINMEKLDSIIANWSRSQSQTQMNQIIADLNDQIELIIANNDDMALGAIDAFKALDIPKEDWPIIVGIDGTEVGLSAMEEGELKGTVYNDGPGQAKAILELSFCLATGGSVDKITEDGRYVWLPYKAIRLENLEDYR